MHLPQSGFHKQIFFSFPTPWALDSQHICHIDITTYSWYLNPSEPGRNVDQETEFWFGCNFLPRKTFSVLEKFLGSNVNINKAFVTTAAAGDDKQRA